MGISDKEAFRILGLPLGVDKDAINERYKNLSRSLSGSKSPDDNKRLEQVVAAYRQLLPLQSGSRVKNNNNKAPPIAYNDDSDASSEENWKVLCRLGDARNHISKPTQELTDAEKEKTKAEKRRAKKKRRKDKKKVEKLENDIVNKNNNYKRNSDSASIDDDDEDEDEEEEEEEEIQGLDPNSAFVANAAAKKGFGSVLRQEEKKKVQAKPPVNNEPNAPNGMYIEPIVLQSRQLAIRGNEAANVGQYAVAVRLFSDAIKLNPVDHRFFGNRSFCYDQLGQHDKALRDAEKSIKIAPQWPKGHFRKGTSLKGLGKYLDAEAAFEEVIRLDKGCQEARDEINRVRINRIIEMGFTERQANSAITKYINVQPALDALLAGEFKEQMEDVFYSDGEDDLSRRVKTSTSSSSNSSSSHGQKNVKMNPRNPEGLTSLWVGNVLPEVTEKQLSQIFSKQGHVSSVRLLKEKYCAFVNYGNKAAASRAMENLQGYDLLGQKLLIKFPDNPIVNGTHNIILRKPKAPSAAKNTQAKPNGTAGGSSSAVNGVAVNGAKLKGPVNGDECYFWRTTGCVFGDNCKHKHIPGNKGVDKKPWQN